MSAVNANALSKFTGILYVAPIATPTAFQRLASVRGLIGNLDFESNVVNVKADDTGTVIKGVKPETRIEGTFLENADRDVMKLILGGTDSNVAGTPVAGATQDLANPFTPNLFVPIENQNGDGSALTINSVSGSVDGALVADDDYSIVKNTDGVYGIVMNTVAGGSTLTTLAQVVTIDYDYTPNATESLSIDIAFQEPPRLVVKIEAEDPADATKKRTIILTDSTYEGTYGMEFLDVVEAGDLAGSSFNFKANDGAQMQYSNQIL